MNPLSLDYNFLGLPDKYSKKEDSLFIILPVPYESTTSYGRGTSQGPKAIIDASRYIELYDEELMQETYKLGIHTLPFMEPASSGPEEMINKLANYVQKEIVSYYNENKILFSLGGEHSISAGLVKGFSKKYPDLSVLHFDAHADLRDSYQGESFSHACAARRMLEHCPVISCGIRSISAEEVDFAKKTKQKIFFGKSALNKTSEVNSLLSGDIYITLDVDVLDPSVMPSTGTPEPDGWTWRELCDFLKEIICKKYIVGLDIVELSPLSGISAPDFSIAKLIYRIMGYVALSKQWM